MSFLAKLSLAFAAGAFGGLLNGLTVWFCGQQGFNQWLGVQLAPALTPNFLYPRLVWGGLWGWLFLLNWGPGYRWRHGLITSLAPTIGQLLYVFPYHLQKGLLGWDLGRLTPLLVVFFNAVWGLGAAFWLGLVNRKVSR